MGTEDKRAKPRVEVTTRARLRDRHGNKHEVTIVDLSITGFRAAEAHYIFDVGQTVWLTIPGLEGLEARIAWRRDRLIGGEFARPLYPSVLDHIVQVLRG